MWVRMSTVAPIFDRARGGKDQASGLNPSRTNQAICQFPDRPGRTAEQDYFEATRGVEMDVRRGDDHVEVQVLQLRQTLGDPADVVVIDQGDDPHRLLISRGDRFLDQRGPHQAADRLAPVGIAVLLAISVEFVEQLAADRDAESNEGVLHAREPPTGPVGVWFDRSAARPALLRRDVDPPALGGRAGHGGFDEGHAGDAVVDPGVIERNGDILAESGPKL